ncbi:hypothetical protein CR983_02330 [Candidatus Saccharibacteria bacterium]|nr:MAG: hypothetical protein CR983_02330 [Candidatus Saccharibacteria bacterium]
MIDFFAKLCYHRTVDKLEKQNKPEPEPEPSPVGVERLDRGLGGRVPRSIAVPALVMAGVVGVGAWNAHERNAPVDTREILAAATQEDYLNPEQREAMDEMVSSEMKHVSDTLLDALDDQIANGPVKGAPFRVEIYSEPAQGDTCNVIAQENGMSPGFGDSGVWVVYDTLPSSDGGRQTYDSSKRDEMSIRSIKSWKIENGQSEIVTMSVPDGTISGQLATPKAEYNRFPYEKKGDEQGRVTGPTSEFLSNQNTGENGFGQNGSEERFARTKKILEKSSEILNEISFTAADTREKGVVNRASDGN